MGAPDDNAMRDMAVSPDGSKMAFASSRTGKRQLYARPVGAAGVETLLLESERDTLTLADWSGDRQFLLFYRADPQTSSDLRVRPMTGEPKPWVFLKTPFVERLGTP